jgi:NAD(P)-dependent dehydrogenase (short-subunit alcohol dehydrogenase family)
MLGVDGKVAIVTGGSRGLGKTMCHELANNGVKVAFASRNEEAGHRALKELKKTTDDCFYIKTDVRDYTQVQNLVKKTVEKFGMLDFMINNAGIFIGSSILDIKQEDLHNIFKVNVFGLIYCTQIAAKEIIKEGHGGRIINVSSIIGMTGKLGCSAYTATKGAVNALTKNMAIDLAPYNILVNTIVPGVCDSEINAHIGEEGRKISMKKIPLNRWASPEEIAKGVLYLCSDLSTYVTGESLVIDGGYLSGKEISESDSIL